MEAPSPPDSFQQSMNVPAEGYRTSIVIKHEGRMTEVLVTFSLRQREDGVATYAAPCPRCAAGEIVVPVRLTAGAGRLRAVSPPSGLGWRARVRAMAGSGTVTESEG